MPAENLTDLADRKQLLILQADLHRAVLETEVASARSRLLWVTEVREKLPKLSGWVTVGGAVAGFLVLRRWRTAVKWVPAAVSAWRWLRKLRTG
jgi:hypothetical protein